MADRRDRDRRAISAPAGSVATRVVCYPQPGKAKALLICEAFAAGVRACGGRAEVCATLPHVLKEGAAFFYGVRPMHSLLWEQCKAGGRSWYYADNAYFDCARERYFRVTRNAIQHDGRGYSDGSRFQQLGILVKPMRHPGSQIVVACAQSEEFMRCVAGDPQWLTRAVEEQRRAGHQVLVRYKGEKRPLAQDLERARLLVTWSSAAAVTALLEGVPVECARACCAHGVAAPDRERWASVLADNHWTLGEMQDGTAWRALNA